LNSSSLVLNINFLTNKEFFTLGPKNLKKVVVKPKKRVLVKTSSLSHFDINFLRKERIYTKLKYSRSPAYDTVSGGLAALLSGFIGFLIQEKFGLELLDSGDFYIGLMYCVFLCFSLRPLLRTTSFEGKDYNVLSYKWFLYFYKTLFTLFINRFK